MIIAKDNINEQHDVHTIKILTDIANEICPEIQMEYDCPSQHNSNRMPVLDLEIWNDKDTIRHSFYRKSMSCPYVILERSGINKRTKGTHSFRKDYVELEI